jgi:hypothetical protein
MRRLPLFIASVSLVCLSAPTARASVTSDDLGSVPDTKQITYVAMSPDCHDIAIAAKAANGVELRVNGKTAGTADEIFSALYSPDGAHLVYAARKNKAWSVVLDGKESSASAQPPLQMFFAADSRHLLWVTATAAGQEVAADGAAQKAYSQVAQMTVSPTGFHYAYVALNRDNQWRIVRDGAETGHAYSTIKQIRFSRDGQHLAFVAQKTDGEYVERDGKVYGPYYKVSSPPAFSLDSEHLMFGAYQVMAGAPPSVRGGPQLDTYRVVDGSAADSRPTTQILYSADGNHILDVILDDSRMRAAERAFVEKDEVSREGVDDDVTIGPDGNRIACAGEGQIVVNHKTTGDLAGVGPPLFSPDSQHLAYAVAHGTRMDWFAHNKDWYMRADDESLPGSLVIPTADLENGEWHPNTKVTDQLSFDNGHSYNGQIPYHFDPDGTLVYFRIADGHLYRVHWKPDDATTRPTTRP